MTFNPQPKPVKAVKTRKPMKRSQMRQKSPKKKASKEEIWYMGQVKLLPCAVTGLRPVEVHHSCHGRRGRGKWNGWSCIPLIWPLHSRYSKDGIHNDKAAWAREHGEDWWYIIDTLQAIYGDQYSVDH